MRKTYMIATIVVLVALVMGIFGCAPAATPTTPGAPAPTKTVTVTATATVTPEPEVITWKGQMTYPGGPPKGYFAGTTGAGGITDRFTKWIEEATNGRLIIDLAPPGSLVDLVGSFDAVQKGVLDLVVTYDASWHSGIMPETAIETGLPFAWKTFYDVWDAMYSFGLAEEFEKIYAEHNIKWFAAPMYQHYSIGTNFPIDTPDALVGKKIRSVGVYGDFVKALGATPVVLPSADTYMALKLGTVDGWLQSGQALSYVNYQEVTEYYVWEPNINSYLGCFIVSKDSFEALPEDIQNIIDASFNYIYNSCAIGFGSEVFYDVRIARDEYGVEFVSWSQEDITKVTEIAAGVWDDVAAKSPRCARLVDIVKDQMRAYGRM